MGDGVLAIHRPDLTDLSLDVLGARVERLVGRSTGQRLHDDAMRPGRVLLRASKQQAVRIVEQAAPIDSLTTLLQSGQRRQ